MKSGTGTTIICISFVLNKTKLLFSSDKGCSVAVCLTKLPGPYLPGFVIKSSELLAVRVHFSRLHNWLKCVMQLIN